MRAFKYGCRYPKGEWTQSIFDGDKWGTMCGDGNEYAVLASDLDSPAEAQ
tara:strand:- start:6444 stop:6593 length:150 start_codon:yes stop_codon:yes gene_type:complete